MLTNTRQSDLLWGFGCRCDPRGIPWKNGTVVYALDREIEAILRSRGVTTWHPSKVEIPDAAYTFSDSQFAKVVFWKNAVRRLVDGIQRSLSRRRVETRSSRSSPPTRASTSFGRTREGIQTNSRCTSGFFYVRNNERTRAFWEEGYMNGHKGNSQHPFREKRLVHHYFNNGLQLHVLGDRFASFTGSPKTPRSRRLDRCPRILDPKFHVQNPSRKLQVLGEWDENCVRTNHTDDTETTALCHLVSPLTKTRRFSAIPFVFGVSSSSLDRVPRTTVRALEKAPHEPRLGVQRHPRTTVRVPCSVGVRVGGGVL